MTDTRAVLNIGSGVCPFIVLSAHLKFMLRSLRLWQQERSMTNQRPDKTDSATPCKCGAMMKIAMVEPLPDEPTLMQHTFVCTCGERASFKFLNAVKTSA